MSAPRRPSARRSGDEEDDSYQPWPEPKERGFKRLLLWVTAAHVGIALLVLVAVTVSRRMSAASNPRLHPPAQLRHRRVFRRA